MYLLYSYVCFLCRIHDVNLLCPHAAKRRLYIKTFFTERADIINYVHTLKCLQVNKSYAELTLKTREFGITVKTRKFGIRIHPR